MVPEREKIVLSLKKARGQIDKIVSMLENDEYCIDIMQQNLAALGILKNAHQSLLENHLNTCFKAAMSTDDKDRKETMIKEILQVVKLYNK